MIDRLEQCTERQARLLKLMVERHMAEKAVRQYKVQCIAKELKSGVRALQNERFVLEQRFGVKGKNGLARFAIEHGLVTP